MKFGNDTDHEKSEEGCAVEVIFENHHLLLCAACIFSLILGIPLVLNVLWHLQVGRYCSYLLPRQDDGIYQIQINWRFLPSASRIVTLYSSCIATTARGRGVLRLILYEKRTNLVAIPAMCIQIYIAADASGSRHQMLCVILKLLSILVATNRSVGEAAVALGRLFYLHEGSEDSIFGGMEEENFFSSIFWIHPAIACLIVSILIGENFLHQKTPCDSFCTWDKFEGVIFLLGLKNVLCNLITLVTHILMFQRKRKLEKKRSLGIMVVNYDQDGVTISKRGPDVQSSHKLWKHNRTVVTPMASLMSFLFNCLFKCSIAFFFFNNDYTLQFVEFVALCHLFFLCNLIENVCSPTLRNSLTQKLPWFRRPYSIVNV